MPRQLVPGGGALFHEDLHESALFLGMLPGQRLLARGDLDHEIAQTLRFARLHHQVLRQVVALVEHAQRDHAVLVGRADVLALLGLRRSGLHPRYGIGNSGILIFRLGLAASAGRQQRQRGKKRQADSGPFHGTGPQASGDQAS